VTIVERRKYGHVPFFAPVVVRAGQVVSQASCVNISRGGVGLFSQRFYGPGQRLQLDIQLRVGGKTTVTSLAVRVVWARAEAEGTMLGAEFETPVTPQTQPVLCEALDAR